MAFEWADRLIRHPAVLDAVEAVIGPDILVWNTAVLIKQPRNRDFVSWHQDVYYWGNHPDHVTGAWIALADSTPENGCVQMIPGSHRWGIIKHVDTYGADNMLSRGQTLDRAIDETQAVDVMLRPGEMSLHHTRTVHGSRPNRSAQFRIGFVITYMAPATQMIGPRTGATLVRGRDTHGHFDLEEVRPAYDLEPACLRAHAAATAPLSAAIYTGAAQQDARLAPDRIAARTEAR
jgi:ectoine hydroxylase-related dioxygenase (phytanoyl-CoA dioxygenase family)